MDAGAAHDSEFEDWLATVLNTEYTLLRETLQRVVLAQLEVHHHNVFSAVKERLRMQMLETANAGLPESKASKAAAPLLPIEAVAEPGGRYEDKNQKSPKKAGHTFPRHLHTHMPVDLPDELRHSLEKLQKHVVSTKEDARHYRSAQMRALAGQNAQPLPKYNHWLPKFVSSDRFEVCSAVVIMACTLAMVAEIQYAGFDLGYSLNVTHFDAPAGEIWPHATTVFERLNTTFNVIFLVELLLRIGVHRQRCLHDGWIYFDTTLVTLGWLDDFDMLDFGLDPMILRVVRLSRLLRLLKVLRAVRALETLFLLVRSLQASLGALVWSFVLLWCAQVVTGIFLCQILQDFMSNPDNDAEARRAVFYYFGTFAQATVTMFEITLANWVVSCRVLYTNVSGWFGVFYILYRGCFMFAVIRVITAVFLAETARCAASDDDIAMQLKHRQKEAYCKKMATIFSELDETQQGYISSKELTPLMTDGLLKTWLTTLEIDTSELDQLFKMLDDGDDKIDLRDFTDGMTRIRGYAKSIDVLKLQVQTTQLHKKIDSLLVGPHRSRAHSVFASPVSWMRNASHEVEKAGGGTTARI